MRYRLEKEWDYMKIYYFTRTGRSKNIAEIVAARQGVSPFAISDGKHWGGPVGWLRAGYSGTRGKSLPAIYEKPKAGEVVAVVFPVWADNFPPAVRTFVQQVGRQNIIAVPTSLGSTLKDRKGFRKVIDLVGKEINAPDEL